MLGIPQLTAAVDRLTRQAERNANGLFAVARALNRLIGPVNPIGTFRARIIGETSVDKFRLQFDLPPLQTVEENPEAADVVKGRVIPIHDGVAQEGILTEITDTFVNYPPAGVEGIAKGVMFSASFAWLDNEGTPSEHPLLIPEFEIKDNVPPPDPVGGFGARIVAEE